MTAASVLLFSAIANRDLSLAAVTTLPLTRSPIFKLG